MFNYRLKALSITFLLVPFLTHAAIINTSAVCSGGLSTQPPVVAADPSSCALGFLAGSGTDPSLGGAKATASVAFSLDSNAGIFHSSVGGSAYALTTGPVPPLGLYYYYSATSKASLALDLHTMGAVRPGLVRVIGTGGSFGGSTGGAGGGQLSWSLSPTISGGCIVSFCANSPPSFSVTLGKTFQFSEMSDFEIPFDPVSGGGLIGEILPLTFEFFEADGLTSVQIFEGDAPTTMPEPSSSLLLGGGLLLVVAWSFRLHSAEGRLDKFVP